jgi:hypothetical protein
VSGWAQLKAVGQGGFLPVDLVLAKYECNTTNCVSYSVPRACIVFVVYRIHIHISEYISGQVAVAKSAGI